MELSTLKLDIPPCNVRVIRFLLLKIIEIQLELHWKLIVNIHIILDVLPANISTGYNLLEEGTGFSDLNDSTGGKELPFYSNLQQNLVIPFLLGISFCRNLFSCPPLYLCQLQVQVL